MLVQLGIFGAFFAGFSLIGEWREGVIEAERVTPANRSALLFGRLVRDLVQLFVQALILVGLGYAMGMRGSGVGMVVGVLITLLVGGACAAASNALALTTKSEDVMAPVINMVMMPVLLLSGILLPMTLGPAVAAVGQRLDAVPVGHRRGAHLVLGRVRVLTDAVGLGVGLRPVRPRDVVGDGDVPPGERLTAVERRLLSRARARRAGSARPSDRPRGGRAARGR